MNIPIQHTLAFGFPPFDRLYGEKNLLTEQRAKVIADLEKMLAVTSNPDAGHFDPFGAQAAARETNLSMLA